MSEMIFMQITQFISKCNRHKNHFVNITADESLINRTTLECFVG